MIAAKFILGHLIPTCFLIKNDVNVILFISYILNDTNFAVFIKFKLFLAGYLVSKCQC